MQIQDIILTAGSLVLLAALIPTILGKGKPEISTSLTTGAVLVAFSGVYMSLGLWFSTCTTFVTALCWFTLAVQKRRQRISQG